MPFLGLGLGLPRGGAVQAFSPSALFAASEPGVWYDPSDLTTLYQDAAGTTPVTAVEQPVGLVLDKSKGAVGTNGAKRVNLLTYSEDFSNAAWVTGNASSGTRSNGTVSISASEGFSYIRQTLALFTVSYTVTVDVTCNSAVTDVPLRAAVTLGAGAFDYKLTSFTANETKRITFTFTPSSNGSQNFEVGIDARDAVVPGGSNSTGYNITFNRIDLRLTSEASTSPTYQRITADWPSTMSGSHLSQSTAAARPVLSARVNALVNTATLSTQNVTTLATNYTLRFEGTGSIALSGTGSGTYSAGAHTVTCTAGTLTLTVTGSVTNADLRPANAGVGLPSYQRVGAATSGSSTAAGNADYDSGPEWPRYLRFDGVDDALSSASIDFTSTDKMSVFAGDRKLVDAGFQTIFELSATISGNNGTIGLFHNGSVHILYSKGTVLGEALSGNYTAPITHVLTGLADISADRATLRVNGSQVAQSVTDQGTGNYGNYALYIGARAGSSLRLNGHLYSLIVRGAATDAATITATETWVNQRTKAF